MAGHCIQRCWRSKTLIFHTTTNLQYHTVIKPLTAGASLSHLSPLYQTRCCYGSDARALKKKIENMIIKTESTIESTLYRYAPKILHNAYVIFKKGVRQLRLDRDQYKRMKCQMSGGKRMQDFSRLDQELYQVMKRDYRKILPMVVCLVIPFGWIYFVVALLLPRYLLPHQFVTRAQQDQRERSDYERRVSHHSGPLRHLMRVVEDAATDRQRELFIINIKKLERGENVAYSTVSEIKPMFLEPKYTGESSDLTQGIDIKTWFQPREDGKKKKKTGVAALEALSFPHILQLSEAHGLVPWVPGLGRRWLRARAHATWCLDAAIRREGGVGGLEPHTLTRLCMQRGLDPGWPQDKQREWLTLWLSLSYLTADRCQSLLLHQMLLMPYSSPLWPGSRQRPPI